ncbi:LOW QUALITY PROTEIN: ras-related protein R-Ras-like, partial [Falco cherrug]|uniref:LOW QUALITY PROTEIN: ras-related protein R-Ras-like n=1 Tax=Falco cherrug TaxID=345164 RepID=UPI00247A820F
GGAGLGGSVTRNLGVQAPTPPGPPSYFPPAPAPTIEDTYTKLCTVDGVPARLNILDTAGQEERGGAQEQHLRGGDGFLLVFAVNDCRSFGALPRLLGQIRRVTDRDEPPTLLVGNKAEPGGQRQVPREEAQAFARQNRLHYLEASAKAQLNVDEAFHELVRAIRHFREQETPPALPPPPRGKDPPCCPCPLL